MLVSLGCGTAAPTVTTLTYDPGQNVIRHEAVDVELLIADYGERQLTLRVGLTNHGPRVTTIEREGILLHYGNLEFPVTEDSEHALPPSLRLAPGQHRELWLTFDTGSRVTAQATLKLRSVEQDGRYTEVIALPLEAPVVVPDDDPRDTRT